MLSRLSSLNSGQLLCVWSPFVDANQTFLEFMCNVWIHTHTHTHTQSSDIICKNKGEKNNVALISN